MWKFGETCVLELGHGNCHRLLAFAINKELGGANETKPPENVKQRKEPQGLGSFISLLQNLKMLEQLRSDQSF